MKKIIKWGSPKYIQAQRIEEKYQFRPRLGFKQARKTKICKKTKGEHLYTEVIPHPSDWWYRSWVRKIWKEYRCLCGKKKIEILKNTWALD